MKPRLIERSIPLKLIGEQSVDEMKDTNNGISLMHQWFARRPLTASRATAFAALIDSPEDPKELARVDAMLVRLSHKDINPDKMQEVRMNIEKHHAGRPRVIDPFGGGGSIPLECIRLGCEVYSNDYNPVAAIIQKCTLEYPQKYGGLSTDMNPSESRLLEDIKHWGDWLEDEVKKELEPYFPSEADMPIIYIWARTIQCQSCSRTIPLLPSLEIKKGEIALRPCIDGFDVVEGTTDMPGTIRNGATTCLSCGTSVPPRRTSEILRADPDNDMLVCIVEQTPGGKRKYRKVSQNDRDAYKSCHVKLELERKRFIELYGIDPVPDEIISTPTGKECEPNQPYWAPNRPCTIGQTRWGDLFNVRQKLVMVTILHKIRKARDMIESKKDPGYAECMECYLVMIMDRLVVRNSRNTKWYNDGSIGRTITSSAIEKRWSYSEITPFGTTMGIRSQTKTLTRAVQVSIQSHGAAATVTCTSATHLPYDNETFDAVFTDPPYYDMKSYADLSDYYYVWMRRSIGDMFPDWFRSQLSPKSQECIKNKSLIRGLRASGLTEQDLNIKDDRFYEDMMAKSLSEMHRILKPDGICVIVYSHTKLDSWETLIGAIKKSGFIITAAWPIATEMKERISAQNTASVQSSIYMVARKEKRDLVGYYKTVKRELAKILPKLDDIQECLAREDYLIAAIGFALQTITKYEVIKHDSGEAVAIDTILKHTRQIAVQHRLKDIISGRIADFEPIVIFYVMYRYSYGDRPAQFDSAKKLAQGCGITMADHGIIKKEGDKVHVLGPMERGDTDKIPEENMIDILHKAYRLRRDERLDESSDLLTKYGLKNSSQFESVCKAIVQSSPTGTFESAELPDFMRRIGMYTNYDHKIDRSWESLDQ